MPVRQNSVFCVDTANRLSFMWWYRMSICFVRGLNASLSLRLIALWLSHFTLTNFCGWSSISFANCFNHKTSRTVVDRAMFSDSVVDNATIDWRWLHQLIGPPDIITTCPVHDFRLSASAPQSASLYANISSLVDLWYRIFKLMHPCRNRKMRLSAFQCGSAWLLLKRLRSFTANAMSGRVAPDKYKRLPMISWYGTLPTSEFSSFYMLMDNFWFKSLGVDVGLQFFIPNRSSICFT